ncbi:MAG: hypothetical protein CSA22_05495 [Deltaproteobacteria bacterium]|nr:MAG: hypothetical protein CSA22_05495 [Deltaproteobacteria bacterium]
MHLIFESLTRISTHNGWMMAGVGVLIVFIGLTTLAFTISQLHRCIHAWKHRNRLFHKVKQVIMATEKRADSRETDRAADDTQETARVYHMLVTTLGGTVFSLPRLLELAEKRGLSRPHATLNTLLLAGRIVPNENGFFYWDSEHNEHTRQLEDKDPSHGTAFD